MNEHEGKEIILGLVDVLGRPKAQTYKRKQTVQKDAQKHGEGTQSIQVVVSFGRHFILKSQA